MNTYLATIEIEVLDKEGGWRLSDALEDYFDRSNEHSNEVEITSFTILEETLIEDDREE